MKNRIVIEAILLVVAFLLGFIPQYAGVRRLDRELGALRQENAGAELRDLAGLAFVQASQKNYGLAASTSGRFFSRARDAANETADANRKKGLEQVLAVRDKVTADLAKGDAAAMADLQDLFVKTRVATGAAQE